MMAGLFEVVYDYNNILYKIVESKEVHSLLDDEEYFKEYIKSNSNSIEMILQNTDSTEELKGDEKKITWNSKTTKLLLNCYLEKKEMFRDPKQKKKSLWSGIVKIFKDHGFLVTEDVLDKKFRNLKHHFKTIKDNNNGSKTGQGRISWEYFSIMDDIFAEDKTINTDEVLSSMCSVGKAIKSQEEFEPQPGTSKNVEDKIHVDVGCAQFNKNIIKELGSPISDNKNHSLSSETPSKKRKIVEGKRLQSYRQGMFNLENRRVAALEKIAEGIEKNNKMQAERNDLIRKYLEKQ